MNQSLDPSLDLLLERTLDVPVELVWKAWTTPELLKQWFTPLPWKTTDCQVDLRPGGIFRIEMGGPEGEAFAADGCYLEIVERERLVWTSAMGPGYRPHLPAEGEFTFTAVISFQGNGEVTTYSALLMHANSEQRKQHEEMGFHDGWGTALDQMVAMIHGQMSSAE